MTCRFPAGALFALLFGCGSVDDRVFSPLGIEEDFELTVFEDVGVVNVPVRLTGPHDGRVVARYRAIPGTAQNDCQDPDFDAAEGSVEWPPGVLETTVRVWVGEDDLAETDERFALELEPQEGLPAAHRVQIGIVILDNDRTEIVDAATRGVVPETSADVAAELQGVLDEASSTGRGVVVMAKGNYTVSSVRLPPGVTLSAPGVRWFRPPASPPDIVTLRIEQTGAESSLPSLVEGLGIDGQRDEQGPYRDKEREDAHLVALHGDAELGGRIVATLEGLELGSGTGSGVKIGPDTNLTACRLSANELWRDAITATGGATHVRVRGVDATATEGTGLWLGPRELGFEGSLAMDAEVEDVLIGAGDVEIEATEGSSITLRRLTMTRPPFRLEAPDGVVRIADSVLMLGLPSDAHNHFGPPGNVEITGTTLVAAEVLFDGETEEAARTFSAVTVLGGGVTPSPPGRSPGTLVLDGCRFELSADVEADDVVYAVENDVVNVAVTLRGGTLGPGFTDWFAPDCRGCVQTP